MTHIVVVEDDLYNGMLFRKLLEKRGPFRVTVTESAAELFGLCRGGGVAVVIMDVSLANTHWEGAPVTGVDLCRRMKAEPAIAGIPVILATAHAMRGDSEKLIAESGADDYVAKPVVDHAAFVEQVRSHVREAA
jgi:CheY-like chemotaxis protein